jgi:hypothetical protein
MQFRHITEKNKFMKSSLLTSIFFLSAIWVKGQFYPLLFQKHEKDKDKNMVFKEFNFRVTYEKSVYTIRAIKDSTIFFSAEREVFYETYNKQYLFATVLDSQLIKKHVSTLYSFLPRKVSFIMPIKAMPDEMYSVDFNGETVINDFKGLPLPPNNDFSIIKKVDIPGKKIKLLNLKTKKKTEYPLVLVKGRSGGLLAAQ